MRPRTIILMGPQGSGKGTQLKLLREHLEKTDPERAIEAVQTGPLFRNFIKDNSWAARKVDTDLKNDIWPELFVSVALWGSELINNLDPEKHALFDGFPRVLDEAHLLTTAFHFFERDGIDVVVIDTPRDVSEERMKARGRTDDTEKSIQFRLDLYYSETTKAIEYFKEIKGITVHHVNGAHTIEEVHHKIVSVLELDTTNQ